MNRFVVVLLVLLARSAFAVETTLVDRGGLTNWLYTPTGRPDAAKTYWLVVGAHGAGGNGKGAAVALCCDWWISFSRPNLPISTRLL